MKEKQIIDISLKLESLTKDVKELLNDKDRNGYDIKKAEETINKSEDIFRKVDDSVVRLNVDGTVFLSSWTEMSKCPQSRLSNLSSAKTRREKYYSSAIITILASLARNFCLFLPLS